MGMRCLAFDGALIHTGWAVLETQDLLTRNVIAYGVIDTRPGKIKQREHGMRLSQLYREAERLFGLYGPLHSVAIEEFYIGENPKVGMALNRASGVILLAAEHAALPVHEYKPARWKSVAVGAGSANKSTVQAFMQAKFDLAERPPSDAADAIGIAECHLVTMMRWGLE